MVAKDPITRVNAFYPPRTYMNKKLELAISSRVIYSAHFQQDGCGCPNRLSSVESEMFLPILGLHS